MAGVYQIRAADVEDASSGTGISTELLEQLKESRRALETSQEALDAQAKRSATGLESLQSLQVQLESQLEAVAQKLHGLAGTYAASPAQMIQKKGWCPTRCCDSIEQITSPACCATEATAGREEEELARLLGSQQGNIAAVAEQVGALQAVQRDMQHKLGAVLQRLETPLGSADVSGTALLDKREPEPGDVATKGYKGGPQDSKEVAYLRMQVSPCALCLVSALQHLLGYFVRQSLPTAHVCWLYALF